MKLLEIYDAFAELKPNISNDIRFYVFKPQELPKNLTTAEQPTRLLLPFGWKTRADILSVEETYGVMRWQITDLMLLRPVPQGAGLADAAGLLTQYKSAYAMAFLCNLVLPLGTERQGLQMQAGVFDWPRGGSTWYFGVECIATINEVF